MGKLLFITVLLLLYSCGTRDNQKNKNGDRNDKLDLEINFYPSSGGLPIYTIVYSNKTLSVNDFNEKTNYTKEIFSTEEQNRIERLASNIVKRSDTSGDIIFDSWRIEVSINGIIYYNEVNAQIDLLPSDIRDLINYLIKDSTVKIDLYGFA